MAANKSKEAASSNGEAASARIDGDALRAQRLEGLEEREWVLFGEVWKLKPEIPFVFGQTYAFDRVEGISILFVDPKQAEDFLSREPSDYDVAEIIKSYRVTEGKSSASSRS